MKKVIGILISVLGLAAIFSIGAFAADAKDMGALAAFDDIVQTYTKILYQSFREFVDPIYQALVWGFDKLWAVLADLVAGLLE